MESRKTLTMNWDGLGDDEDDDHFFETYNRLSTVDPRDLASDEDETFYDPRMSFASTMSSHYRALSRTGTTTITPASSLNYDVWMAAPGSITERRKKLLGSMGLDENKASLKVTSINLGHAITRKFDKNGVALPPLPLPLPLPLPVPPPSIPVLPPPSSLSVTTDSVDVVADTAPSSDSPAALVEQKAECLPVSSVSFGLVRSRSEGDIESFSMAKARKEEFIGKVSKQRLTRTSSEIVVPRSKMVPSALVVKEPNMAGEQNHNRKLSSAMVGAGGAGVGAFFLIKNLDTGKEFIVNEYSEDGMWNRLSDLQTGKQLTMEEFEKTVGHCAVVKELMSRAKGASGKKLASDSYILRSLKLSKRKGASLLKNIRSVRNGSVVNEKEKDATVPMVQQQQEQVAGGKNEWVRVRQSGKSQKELSALHLCQELHAHEGCIWTIKFSLDGRFLASGGEDKVIHVWEVQECEVMSLKPEEGNLTPIHPSLLSSMEPGEKKKKGMFEGKKGSSIPEYVHVPQTMFTFSEKPYCSFHGHLDEVLDLSWSKSNLLLSSSMDKTVRLWDLETKTCLKFFHHNDYVTCVQFNPIDDNYFISGSLDAKVRIWNIPARLVVDWIDIHEMVTAVSYTPDAQGAVVGTQKGSCRTYNIEDNALSQTGNIEIRQKKKHLLKKITGFQFCPSNPSKVLVTSGDSRIKIIDGSAVVNKFQGFRNTNSQIAASFTPDGRYIISASEDSNVYVWKHDEPRNSSSSKSKSLVVTQSYECFQSKDVSVATSWPGTIKGAPPVVPSQQSKKNTKENQPSDAKNKRLLPPLPKKSNNQEKECASASPDGDHETNSNTEPGIGDSSANSKRMLPPLPNKKSNNNNNNNNQVAESDNTSLEEEEEPEVISREESSLGASGSASIRHGDSPSISAAATPARSLSSNCSSNDVSQGTPPAHQSAWGMVIVTAGFGGEIRCYQNFGLPRRMSLQSNLFGGPT